MDNALDSGIKFWDVKDNTIVSFEAEIPAGLERAAASVDPTNMFVTTVYKETRTDEEISRVIMEGSEDIPRFRRIETE